MAELTKTPADGFDRKLRVGLLVDGDTTPAWAFRMLESIEAGNAAKVVQVVTNTGERRQRSLVERGMGIFKRLFFIIFSKVDARLSRVRENPFAPRELRPLLADCRWLEVRPERRGFTDRFSTADLEQLAEDEVDVYLRLGFGILKGDILTLAPFGVWSYHHGDNRVNRGLPPGFWEVCRNESIAGVTLQVLSEELDGGRTICRTFVKTNEVYVRRTQASMFWASSALVPRMLERLHRTGEAAFRAHVANENLHPEYYSQPLYSYPSNAVALRQLARSAYRLIKKRLRRLLTTEQWALAWHRSDVDSGHRALWRFQTITPPADRFWADPFVIERDGETHLFFEELVYAANKGTIAHLCIDSGGTLSAPQVVLETDYHLSYPCVFEFDGELYMTPESAANRSVELYRCERLPGDWKHVRTLLADIDAADPTPFQHDGRWWMFVNLNASGGAYGTDELHLYWSDRLDGEWHPHAFNPVVSDVRCARPAGRVFVDDGRLYRPAQDGSRAYGGATVIRCIDVLNTEEYAESTVSRLSPDWQSQQVGTHTLNRDGNSSVVDLLRRRPRWRRG